SLRKTHPRPELLEPALLYLAAHLGFRVHSFRIGAVRADAGLFLASGEFCRGERRSVRGPGGAGWIRPADCWMHHLRYGRRSFRWARDPGFVVRSAAFRSRGHWGAAWAVADGPDAGVVAVGRPDVCGRGDRAPLHDDSTRGLGI